MLSISHELLEKGIELAIDFGGQEEILIPVVVQDARTKIVLLIAHTNREAFEKTQKTKQLYLFSRSRDEIWLKGEISGCTFTVKKILINCRQDSLVYMVWQDNGAQSGACHVKQKKGKFYPTCFYREVDMNEKNLLLEEKL